MQNRRPGRGRPQAGWSANKKRMPSDDDGMRPNDRAVPWGPPGYFLSAGTSSAVDASASGASAAGLSAGLASNSAAACSAARWAASAASCAARSVSAIRVPPLARNSTSSGERATRAVISTVTSGWRCTLILCAPRLLIGLSSSTWLRSILTSAAAADVKIERSQVELDKPNKSLGAHKIKVHLHPEVTVEITALVARSPDEVEFLAKGGTLIAETERAAQEAAEAAQRAAERAAALFEAKPAESPAAEAPDAEASTAEEVPADKK